MKEYFNNRNTLVLTLFTLLGLSIMDIIMRMIVLKENVVNMNDYGAPLVTAVMSTLLIIFALRGKDRLFYIVCGGWLAYFVISHIFSIPESITVTLTHLTEVSDVAQTVAIILGLMSTVCIIVIGGLLVKYMNDGTIHNKAFSVSCIVTMLLLLIFAILSIFDMIRSGSPHYIFATLFGLTHMTMVFLFTFFAYDSAKTQLSKTQL